MIIIPILFVCDAMDVKAMLMEECFSKQIFNNVVEFQVEYLHELALNFFDQLKDKRRARPIGEDDAGGSGCFFSEKCNDTKCFK